MQIIQFLVGASYATIHSFISYTIPVHTPISSLANAASTVSSAVASATSAGVSDVVKKYLFRAAGEEGLAQNVAIDPAVQAQVKAASSGTQQEWMTEYRTVPCIDTSGQTFAIWLNVLYLAPLTVLFVRFFIRSYIRIASGNAKKHGKAEKAGKDAIKGMEKMNGRTNGAVMNGNGHTNGYANGHANGHANGYANGKATNGKAH
jgi:hypothetical protein